MNIRQNSHRSLILTNPKLIHFDVPSPVISHLFRILFTPKYKVKPKRTIPSLTITYTPSPIPMLYPYPNPKHNKYFVLRTSNYYQSLLQTSIFTQARGIGPRFILFPRLRQKPKRKPTSKLKVNWNLKCIRMERILGSTE